MTKSRRISTQIVIFEQGDSAKVRQNVPCYTINSLLRIYLNFPLNTYNAKFNFPRLKWTCLDHMFLLVTIVFCSNFYFSIKAITLKMKLPIRKILLVTVSLGETSVSSDYKKKILVLLLFETDRFNAHKNINERKLLWHGTNVAVVATILKSGLRIMPHSGGRVGRGIYFASENSKSAGYGVSSVTITSLNFRPLTENDHLPEIFKICKLQCHSVCPREGYNETTHRPVQTWPSGISQPGG